MKTESHFAQLQTQLKKCENSGNHAKVLNCLKKILKKVQNAKELGIIFDQITPSTISDFIQSNVAMEEKDQNFKCTFLWFLGASIQKNLPIVNFVFNYLVNQLESKDLPVRYLASKALFMLCQHQAMYQDEYLKREKANDRIINVGTQYYLRQLRIPNSTDILPATKEPFIILSETYARRDDILFGEFLSPAVLSKVKYLYLTNPIIRSPIPTKFGTRLIGDIFTCITPEENGAILQWMEQGGFLFIEIDEIDKPVAKFLQQFGIVDLRLSMQGLKPTYIWGNSEMVDPKLRKTEIYYQPPTIIFKATSGDPLLTLANGVDTKIWGKKMGNGYLVVGALVSALDTAVSYILFQLKAQNRLHLIIDQMRLELITQKKIFIPDFANKNGITPGELKTLIEENISRGQLLAYIQEWFLIAYEE